MSMHWDNNGLVIEYVKNILTTFKKIR